jgi:hypothetical protein
MKIRLFLPLLLLLASTRAFSAPDDTLKKTLQAVVIENLNASQKENLDALLKTIHKDSPVYQATRVQSDMIFKQYRLKYKLHSVRLIGQDGDFAFARIEVTTTKVEGPGFRNNRTSILQVFKKEGEQWKYWNQLLLELTFVN